MKINLRKNFAFCKIMKITLSQIVLALLFTGISFAEKSYAQAVLNQIVSISVDDTRLSSVLKQIEKDANVKFVYSKNVVKIDQNVSIQATDQKLWMVLDKLLNSNGISYEAFDNRIVLSNKRDKILSVPEENGKNTEENVQFVVSGKVTDSKGQPLIGVTVKVKGTNIGASTNGNGQYSLTLPDGNNTLVFTYIGYITQEISVDNQTTIDVRMLEDAKSLDEIVVIGYGTLKKSSVTAAISKIENEILDQVPSGRPETALAGRLAGVSVSTTRNRPGDAPKVRIRGSGSITASNEPLIVIDGFAGGSFNNVNMNDVQSIEVLKDASSAAIYGSRGSGGVIIVTTKKGKSGKPQLNFNAYTGIANAIGHNDFLSEQEYYDYIVRIQNREYVWAGGDPSIPLWGDSRRPASYQVNPVIKEGNVNWQNVLHNTALLQSYNLSVGGSNDNINYYVSGVIQDEEGTLMNTRYKKYSVRANLNLKINSVISTGFMINPNFSYRRNSPFSMEGLVKTAPYVSKDRRPNGTYPKPLDYWGAVVSGGVNPLAILEGTSITSNEMNNVGEMYLELNVLNGLKFRSSLGTNINFNTSENYSSPSAAPNGLATGSALDERNINVLNENVLSYNKTLNEVHSFSAILGASYQKATSRNSAIGALSGSFGNGSIQTLNNAVISPTTTSTTKSQWGLASYFSRINYGFKDKYLMTASIRTDGSSRFGAENKWGNFPSASIAWRASQEEFLKNSKIIDELKFRISYGVTGNFNIGNFDYLGTISDVNYSPGGVLTKGQAQTNFADEKLRWEKNESYNFGVELGLFNRRLNFVVDYFNKKTNDLLYNVGIPAITGFANSVVNIGDISNKGLELEISTRNLTGNFKWETAFNWSYSKNKVISLGGVNESIYTHPRGMSWLLRVGEPMFSYYGYKAIGVLQNSSEVSSLAVIAGSKPGFGKYEDVNKDGKITVNDRVILGNYQPKFFMGMVNDFSWKNFDMSIVMQAAIGGKMYNYENAYYQGSQIAALRRSLVEKQWWSEAEPGDGKSPAAGTSNLSYLTNSDFYLEDASFLGLRNLNIGYKLSSAVAKKLQMKNCRVYLSMNNLFMLTRKGFHGYNPEGYTGATINGIEAVGYNQGSEPINRVVSFGMNVNF